MSVVYADSSALARVYLGDEPGSNELESLLFAPDAAVTTSELSALELAGAAKRAERAGRIERADVLLATMDADLATQIGPLRLAPDRILPEARRLVLGFRLRALDAIHLAVALDLRERIGGEVVFVTRDADQGDAARALGFPVA